MATVKFYGNLKQYGDKFKMSADTAAQALNGLYAQVSGLKQSIMDGYFRVRINKQDVTEDTLQFGLHSKLPEDAVIHIVPRIAGNKNNGMFSVIAGAVMVIAGAFLWWTPVGAPMIMAGVGLMISGVAQMLTKIPKTGELSDGVTNKNTAFSNLNNTIAQGSAVPLCYGKMMIGSKVLSQGIETL